MKPYSKAVVDRSEDGTERVFNVLLSSARVNVEHAIGLLKLRFPLSRRLSFVLGTPEGNQRAIDAIRAMCIMHNYFLDLQDAWEPSPAEQTALVEGMDRAYEVMINSDWHTYMVNQGGGHDARTLRVAGERKRDALRAYMAGWEGRITRSPFWWR
jgi:hypothetical protein